MQFYFYLDQAEHRVRIGFAEKFIENYQSQIVAGVLHNEKKSLQTSVLESNLSFSTSYYCLLYRQD